MGEVMLCGKTVMKGYLRGPTATEEVFRGGWFRSGDLAVWQPDGYIEIKDRKEIIISGGENMSSLEVEEVLHRHPAIMEGAVVAKPGPTRGETPCAFVTLKLEATPASPTSRRRAPSCFGPLPKTSTGKQEIHPARAGEGGGLT
jgi:3-(methylthio)propionyl---CoA ligase